ncbi:MAG: hypothetical protein H7Y13_16680 [Sphingobacteriaceae bacterium]|nr:hypothetical protein [Sphingobacteriaceae bacterium]
MKKISVLLFAALLAVSAFSQTNTFPSSGSTGVGTTTPATTLEVKDGAPIITLTPQNYNGLYRSYFGTHGNAIPFLVFGNNGQNEIRAGNTAAGGFLDFITNNSNGYDLPSNGIHAMRLAANGYLGIGNINPQHKLDVSGSGHFSGDLKASGKLVVASGTYEGTMIFNNNTGWRSGISTRDGGVAEMRIWTKNYGSIYLANNHDGELPATAVPTDGMKLMSNNLGIGSFTATEAIGYKFHVKGTSKFTEDAIFDSRLTANNLIASNAFFVGYTSDPASSLENKFAVNGNSYFNGNSKVTGDITALKLILTNGQYDGTLVFNNNEGWKSGISSRDAGNAEMRIWTRNANSMYFANGYDGSQVGSTLPTDGMKLADNKLGIGGFTVNEAIGYKLHVKGTSNFTDKLSGTSASFTGNVGIGTITDDGINKLQVNGRIKTTALVISGELATSPSASEVLTLNPTTREVEKVSLNNVSGAPVSGSTNYIQNQSAVSQPASINISGNAAFGGTRITSNFTTNLQSSVISDWYNNGSARSKIFANGGQEWNLNAGPEVGRVLVSTPGGKPGITMFTAGDTNRSDFYYLDNTTLQIGFVADYNNGGGLSIKAGGNLGVGVLVPTARLHLKAGTDAIAPFKFTAGSNLSTPQSGAMEWDGSKLYQTDNAGNRNTIAYLSDLSATTINESNLVHRTLDESIAGTKTFSGNVGIGTTNPGTYQLAVKGTIKTQAIKVDPSNWSDYVFYDSYKLPSLKDVEKYIKEKQHLPDIPSEADVKKNGIELGEMNSLLLKKIEELTLYMIEKDKQLERANEKIDALAKKVDALSNKIKK